MNDKTKYKNWVEGDTFAVRIENIDPKYDGQYLILTKFKVQEKIEIFGDHLNSPIFYIRLTRDSKIPTTKEEIERLESIKIDHTYWNERFFPSKGFETSKEMAERKKHLKFYPDENMYLYSYAYILDIYRGASLANFEYIGNFNVEVPYDDYIAAGTYDSSLIKKGDENQFIKDILYHYEQYNKKQSLIYTEEGKKKVQEVIELNNSAIEACDKFIISSREKMKSENK